MINQLGYALIFFALSRWQGPDPAGVFTLALRYSALFLILALWGSEGYLVREISADPSKAFRLLANSLLSRSVFAVISFLTLLIVVTTFAGYPQPIYCIILLLALGILPEALLRIIQSVFFASQQFLYPAIAAILLSTIRVVGGFYLVFSRVGLDELAIFLATTSFIGLILWWLFLRWKKPEIIPTEPRPAYSKPLHRYKFNRLSLRDDLLKATPFAFMEIFVSVELQADILIMSFLLPTDQIGFYAAAHTIIAMIAFTQYGYHAALYPMMTRLYQENQESLWSVYRRLFRIVGWIVFPAAVLLSGMAEPILHAIFTPAFDPSVSIMQWLVWVLVLQFLDEPNSRLIIISGHQSVVTRLLGASMLTNIILNIILIPIFGIPGAAIAKLVSKVCFTILNGIFVYKNVSHINVLPVLGKLVIGTAIMAGFVLALPSYPLAIRLVIGSTVYVLITIMLGVVNRSDFYGLITRKGYCN